MASCSAERKRITSKAWRYKNPVKALLCQCRNNAAKRGLEYSLDEKSMSARISRMKCEVTGIRLIWSSPKEPRMSNPRAPSVDRMNPKNGYVPGNVRVVCWVYNRMKGDLSERAAMKLLREMKT